MNHHSSSAADRRLPDLPTPLTERVIKAATNIQSQVQTEADTTDPSQGSAGMIVAIADGITKLKKEEPSNA